MKEPEAQPLQGHLGELRTRLVRCLLVVGTATGGAFFFAPAVFHWLIRPYMSLLHAHAQGTMPFLQTLEPAETFKLSFLIALLLGVVITLPYLFFEIWGFVRPGLAKHERRWIVPILSGGTVLFGVGTAFAYVVVLPIALRFFWEYSLRLGVTPGWTVKHYFGFVLGTEAAFGFAFELPLVTTLLAAVGVIDGAMLARVRRYAIFIICCVAAILTPPDVVSLILMAVPLIGLYEISILLARLVGRKGTSV